jgi:hypothetical protein
LLFSQNLVKDNHIDMAAIMPPAITGSTLEQETSECIPSPAGQSVDNKVDTAIPDHDHSETTISTISLVRTTADNESDKGEIFGPKWLQLMRYKMAVLSYHPVSHVTAPSNELT